MSAAVQRSGGSLQHPSQQLDDELEERAASIEGGAGPEAFGFGFQCLTEDTSDVMKLFAEVGREVWARGGGERCGQRWRQRGGADRASTEKCACWKCPALYICCILAGQRCIQPAAHACRTRPVIVALHCCGAGGAGAGAASRQARPGPPAGKPSLSSAVGCYSRAAAGSWLALPLPYLPAPATIASPLSLQLWFSGNPLSLLSSPIHALPTDSQRAGAPQRQPLGHPWARACKADLRQGLGVRSGPNAGAGED